MSPGKTAFPHLVIRASAGTGKTFQLSNRFLGLVSGEQQVDCILAATFARKAAGEILDRVMLRLAEAADDPARLSELAAHLNLQELDRPNCLTLLRRLASSLHRLRIGTLDGFFLQLASNFSLELGLPAGWQIVDELDDLQMQAEAVQAVLERDSVSDTLALLHMLTKGETTRSITQQVQDIVTQLYAGYRETGESSWRCVPRCVPLGADAVNDALTQLAQFSGWTDSRFEKAHQKHLKCAEAGDWESFIASGIVAGLLGDGTYYKKPIDLDVGTIYAPLVEHARAELMTRLANQTEATWRLLKHFDEAYTALKLQRRGLRFDDVTHLLAEGIAERQLDGVDHRLDGDLCHLLLDEFQDTSLEQWRVIRAFAEKCVSANGNSLLCVGDVKQAIYGWRGGVSEIFDAVSEQLKELNAESLTKSYRSSQSVIDTVNRTFAELAANPAMSEFAEVGQSWRKRYEPHETARVELPGYCQLRVAPEAQDGNKQAPATLSFAADEIARLAAEHPGRSIGVLVRRNSAVARLIFELRSRHQLSASEEGGNPLTDSVAVQLILSLLKLIDHPGDLAARFHVAGSPLGELVEFQKYDDDNAALALALRLRDEIFKIGYGRLIYGWTMGLAAHCDQRELSRLMQLVELAYSYEPLAMLRTDHFVTMVRQKKVEDPAPADVRVMTIHQAKGLQFDIVVLPELDVNLKSQPRQLVVGRPQPTDPINIVCRYASESVQRLLPENLQRLFERWPVQIVNESLCLLYVAMTRAVYALHMVISPRPKERTHPKTFAGVLRGALAPGQAAVAGTILFEHGCGDWDKKAPNKSPSSQPAPSAPPRPFTIKLKASEKLVRGLERRTPSSLEGGQRISLSHEMRLQTAAALSRGGLIHAWMERIEWLDDGEPSDGDLETAARRFLVPGLDVRSEIKSLRSILEKPAVQALLLQSGYQDLPQRGFSQTVCKLTSGSIELRVDRERSFAVRDGNALLGGSIDRLVTISCNGKPIAAEIIDFKTDRIHGEAEIAQRTEFYRPQLDAYRSACAKMLRLPADQIVCQIAFLEPGVVRTV